MIRVVGLDLSLTATGWATGHGTGTIDGRKLRGPQRLDVIARAVRGLLGDDPANSLVVLEQYAFSRAGAHAHELGEVGGVVRWTLWRLGFRYVEVIPTHVKQYACGRGNATKDEVLAAAVRRGGDTFTGTNNNEADAWWCRQIGLRVVGDPAAVTVPMQHLKVLEKLRVPQGVVRHTV